MTNSGLSLLENSLVFVKGLETEPELQRQKLGMLPQHVDGDGALLPVLVHGMEKRSGGDQFLPLASSYEAANRGVA